MGDGTFGRVLEVRRKPDGKFFACKVIRAVPRYIESAVIEAQIIERVQHLDKEGISRCMHIVEHFQFKEHGNVHYAIVSEVLGKSLYDFMKMNAFRGTCVDISIRFSFIYCEISWIPIIAIAIVLAWNRSYTYRSKGKMRRLSSRKIFCW
eukprot:TRINITY_DN833_c0_g1_i6.p2 TRINITY_DN833_c0_g1~~TRINITY_DN833_c0_g1_i6.p2  ORF type:complete len:150 (-),score=3.32 TRINITY_DN833_c0_g1_i6:507-956(-)